MFLIINFGGDCNEKMVIFDPAMCCSTGVCGPSVDKNLLRVCTFLNRLEKKGVDVLPITMVDREVVKVKEYPTNEEFVSLLELPKEYIVSELKAKKAKSSNEVEWINTIDKESKGKFAVIKWTAEELKREQLALLL